MSKRIFIAGVLFTMFVVIQGCDNGGGSGTFPVDASCKAAAEGTYPLQSTSPYVLPYSIGETYAVAQGNCTNGSHTDSLGQQFAYDFAMPIGTTLVASRGGVVVGIEESFMDGTGEPGEENFVAILHDDGTTARYIHLTTLGVLVQLQEPVSEGDAIAMSGNSGNSSGPHLHFDVVLDPNASLCLPQARNCFSVPVNFRNTSPHENGLIEGIGYSAQ